MVLSLTNGDTDNNVDSSNRLLFNLEYDVPCENFQIVIISTVRICKKCLQTASASGGLCPWTSVGDTPPMKVPVAANGCRACRRVGLLSTELLRKPVGD